MSKNAKKGSSCLGLFVKSWLLSALFLSGAVAATAGLGVRLLGWDAQSWTDFSAWSSLPVMALLGVSFCSTFIALLAATLVGVASAFLGKGGKSGAVGSSKPKARPQSSRKTTV